MCYIDTARGYEFEYVKVIEGRANLQSVKLSVQATNTIYISLSRDDPITKSNYEIVLGAEGGTKSVIRASHQGDELVYVYHTNAQFHQVNTK